ncbi:hypothetical protein KFK09_022780 [Dendrobium nobile]|uniref:Kinesin-like protein n=1 Tax=Dendrobium nobile TaxID=94219 RepID=A0A8T3AJR2_DENNO|nr:hypothetical protein KFK09_022780 [Dendrobium nobile]
MLIKIKRRRKILLGICWNDMGDILPKTSESVRMDQNPFSSSNGTTVPSQNSASNVDGDVYDCDDSYFVPPNSNRLSMSLPAELAGAIPLIDRFQVENFLRAMQKQINSAGKRVFFSRKSIGPAVYEKFTLEDMLCFQKDPIPTSLLKINSDLVSRSVKIFQMILKYMGIDSSDKLTFLSLDERIELITKLYKQTLKRSELRDEFFAQISKQTRNNPDRSCLVKAWELMYLFSSSMPPSMDIGAYLSEYAHKVVQGVKTDPEVQILALNTLSSLKRSVKAGPRLTIPAREEIEALLIGKKLTTIVFFLDETFEEITYDMTTTVGDAVQWISLLERFLPRQIAITRAKREWELDILSRYNLLEQLSKDNARQQFLRILRTLPYGNSVFFSLRKIDDPIGLLPGLINLGINKRGVHFFRPVPKEYLHSSELRDIMQFGSSNTAVFFKMRVAGVLHIFQFETKQGEEICVALQTHINDVMLRRYSKARSVAVGPPQEDLTCHVNSSGLDNYTKRVLELTKSVEESHKNADKLLEELDAKKNCEARMQEELERLKASLQSEKEKLQEIINERDKLKTLYNEKLFALQAALTDKRTIEAKFPKLDSPEHLSLENHARMESMLAFGIGDGGENVSIRNSVNNSQTIRKLQEDLKICTNELQASKDTIKSLLKEKLLLEQKIQIFEKKKKDEISMMINNYEDKRQNFALKITEFEQKLVSTAEVLRVAESTIATRNIEIDALHDNLKELQELRDMKEEIDRKNEQTALILKRQGSQLAELEALYKEELVLRKRYYNIIEGLGMVSIENVSILQVSSFKDLMAVILRGSEQRHVAGTQMNDESSRSHLILSIIIESTNRQTQTLARGKLSFVDLAGSERIKKSGSWGNQLKEAQSINKSLSALGDVISALCSEGQHIPYRNHKLTMLMSDSLGGNAKTLMFVNASPAETNLEETYNSLTYASRVRCVVNDPSRNVSSKEIARLKKLVSYWKEQAGKRGDDELEEIQEERLCRDRKDILEERYARERNDRLNST